MEVSRGVIFEFSFTDPKNYDVSFTLKCSENGIPSGTPALSKGFLKLGKPTQNKLLEEAWEQIHKELGITKN